MAENNVNKPLSWIIFAIYSVQIIHSQTYSIDKVTVADCVARGNVEGQTRHFYYDISQLDCVECAQTNEFQKLSDDGLRCECQPGYRLEMDFGGGEILCAACGANQYVASNGWECIACDTSVPAGDTCPYCSDSRSITVERTLDGSYSGTPSRSCLACEDETHPNENGDRCERCSQVLSVLPSQQDCACPPEQATGGVCFQDAEDIDADGQFLIHDVSYSGTEIQSEWLVDNMLAAYSMCLEDYKNITACQILSNMCVLNMYDRSLEDSSAEADPCSLYLDIYNSEDYMPQLYIDNTDDALEDKGIKTTFKFPETKLKFVAAMYSYNGSYLGMESLENGLFQFCKNTEDYMNAAYVFGTKYSQSCKISAKQLYDMETILYDVYLEYKDGGDTRLYRIPIRVINYEKNGDEVNKNDDDTSDWELHYRMYLVDTELGRQWIDPADPAGPQERPVRAKRMRYAKNINITLQLQEGGNGKILPPYITVEYGELKNTDYDSGEADVSFDVVYLTDITQFNNDMGTAVGVLCAVAIIFSVVQSWGWSRRQGQVSIDCYTLLKFVLFSCGNLANAFFVTAFGGAMYYWIFFKNQETVVLLLPSVAQEQLLIAFVAVAFVLKTFDLVHLIIKQVTVDIFFIDWERPRGKVVSSNDVEQKGEEAPISIWRTYFAANEYNEIQSCRKFNHVFQKFVVVLFLSVVGFENIATRDPESNFTVEPDEYTSSQSWTLRFAIGTLAYVLVSVCQWIFHTFIYERFVEDKIRQYVDFCSMSNISVFIFENSVFGYYIHGRSVHGRADTGMAEMAENMKREEEDLCGMRGLLPNTEQQTFQIAVPPKLRAKYDQVLLPLLAPPTGATMANAKKDAKEGHLDAQTSKMIAGHGIVNRFFQAFIDHSLKNVDYYVKDKMLLESILEVEFETVTDKGFFYNDNGHSFDQVLFFGNETTLTIFDILLFAIIDLMAQNFLLAAVITYFVDEIIAAIRDGLGRRNLAKKTLVDERFLI